MPRSSGKPRGRTTSYACFVQACRADAKKANPDGSVVFTDFSRECSARWKSMSEKEKERFFQLAEKDKHRYESEMRNYAPPKGEKKRRSKASKDPNAPKRPLSAFFIFSGDERPKLRAINPDWSIGDVAKELGRMWAEVSPELKLKYEAMARNDKARYEKEKMEYSQKGRVTTTYDDDDEDDYE